MQRPDGKPCAANHTNKIENVDSLEHPLARTARQLLTRDGRRERRQILIDDEENILQAIESNVTITAIGYSGNHAPSERLLRRLNRGTTIYEFGAGTSRHLFGNEKIARLFAIADMPPVNKLDALASSPRDLVVLEDLTIVGNVGAMVRTALALGIGGVVLLNANAVDIYDRRLIRASRGYVFALPMVAATTAEFIRFCRTQGIHILATTPDAETLLHEIAAFSHRLAIVFGNEKRGCSHALNNAATLRARIPTVGAVESLNVSVAAGITLYARLRFNHAPAADVA